MKFIDLNAQYKSIRKDIDIAVEQVIDSGTFIGGKEVEEFEKEIAEFCEVKYAIGVNSGTDALFLSLKALGIKSGDEVITTPFTFIATAEAIASCGAKIIFVDINLRTFNINSELIERAITPKTKAIIPVHLFGQMADMEPIMKIARKYKLWVIEDAAQSIGAKYKNKIAGSIGDVGCLSFFPSKNLGAYGDGGMIITNNKKLAEQIKLLKNHGSSSQNKYLNLSLGTNSRLDALQAAILRVKLRYLQQWNKERNEKAKHYTARLNTPNIKKHIRTPYVLPNDYCVFHQYTIFSKYRDDLQKFLAKNGVPAMIYYNLPLHLQPLFKSMNYKMGNFPKAEEAANKVLSLPIYPELSGKDQNYIIDKIEEFFCKN
jgi:dTDP-4-amino-4,6-dideoxygalactose transaminase